MKVLITGGFGFIGGRLAQFLSKRGLEVSLGTRHSRIPPSSLKNLQVCEIDWESDSSINAATEGIRTIIHLAAPNAMESFENPEMAHKVNCINSQKLLNYAIKNKVKKIIYLSTIHVYGNPLSNELLESNILNPSHPYAKTHFEAEGLFTRAHNEKKIECAVIRLSNSFGAPAHEDVNCWSLVINDFCLQSVKNDKITITSKVNSTRDFITMTDTCLAILFFINLNLSSSKNCIFNVGGKWKKSVLEIANIIKKRAEIILDKDIEISHNISFKESNEKFDFNINKLIQLGFEPSKEEDFINEIDSLLFFCKDKI